MIETDSGLIVIFIDHYRNHFRVACGNVFSYIIRPDGKLPVTSVNQNSELNRLRPSMTEDRVDCGTYCSACKNDIIHKYYFFFGNITRKDAGSCFGQVTYAGQIIAVKRNIDCTDRNGNAFRSEHILLKHYGQRYASPKNAEKDDVVQPAVFFNDFVRDPGHAAIHSGFIHNH